MVEQVCVIYNVLCYICLQLEYFETVLQAYFSPEAQQALKSFQENLLEKACESVAEALENPGHHRRPTRGSEDTASDGQPSVSPDDLLVSAPMCSTCGLMLLSKLMIDVKYICQDNVTPNLYSLRPKLLVVLSFLDTFLCYNGPCITRKMVSALQAVAQQYSSDLLQGELERTRLNIACFMDSTLQSTSAPAASKPAAYSSYHAPAPQHVPVQTSSPSFRRQQTGSSSPVVSRRRR
jgi:hypothetical protein